MLAGRLLSVGWFLITAYDSVATFLAALGSSLASAGLRVYAYGFPRWLQTSSRGF